jgi:hypothetical protein
MSIIRFAAAGDRHALRAYASTLIPVAHLQRPLNLRTLARNVTAMISDEDPTSRKRCARYV